MAKFPLSVRVSYIKPKTRTGPTINRGKGNNNASTPWKFIRPVEAKFGKLEWDLAADAANAKAHSFLTETENSLTVRWHSLTTTGLCWLNPPYFNITVWARKCAEEVQLGWRGLLLVPASVGANWFEQWVWPYADVYSVGRICFDDCYDRNGKLITDDYPKDLILCHFDWRNETLRTGERLIFWKEWKRAQNSRPVR